MATDLSALVHSGTDVRSLVYAAIDHLSNTVLMMDGTAAMLRMIKIALQTQVSHLEEKRSRLLVSSVNPSRFVSHSIVCLRSRVITSLFEQEQMVDRALLRIEQILLEFNTERQCIRGPWEITQEDVDMELEMRSNEAT